MKEIVVGMFLVLAFLGLVLSGTSVSTGHVGVVTHFGAVQPDTLSEGIHMTRPWPFASVHDVSTQVDTTEAEAAASSKDLQAVHTKISVQWSILGSSATKVMQGFGGEEQMEAAILAPAIQEVVKSISAKYTAEELVTQRSAVKLGIEKELEEFVKKTLAEKSAIGAIKIANIAVTDFSFSKEFNDSIEAKVKAEQDSLRAKNEKDKKITEAEATAKTVTLAAEADAAKTKLNADAIAYQTDAESKARAAAITREAAALNANPTLIQLRAVERWDGKVPTYMMSGASTPMIQLPH
jgi:prohibitin 2